MPRTMPHVQDQLAALAKEFHSFRSDKHQSYKDLDEAQTRLTFIDEFWRILGWDVKNLAQVQVETRVGTKKPDYRFLSGKSTVFFVEAKKPIEKLKDPKHIFQAKSYGWSDNVPLVILMDFEEFRPFRTRTQPKFDKPEQGLLKKLDMLYTDYADRADDLLNTFGREAVMAGSLSDMLKFTTAERNATVDKEFLKTLADWRERLASHIALRNSFDDDFALAEAVQRILDRLVFVRILEDRDIETEQHLERLTQQRSTQRGEENIYDAFVKLSQRLAPKYNGLLFNAHPLSEELAIDDAAFRPIVKELHANESPYRFDVIPVDVLGTIYERFLGDEIRLTTSGRAKVETKPEVRKAGGVYYTPQYIVEYIVENTVGNLLKKCKTPDDVRKLRICDPACGSGSFLLGAFDALIRWCEAWYAATKNPEKDWVVTLQPAKNRKKAVTIPLAFKNPEGAVRLTAYAKGRIVQDCLYGVDLDRQATEVAQMSLYIKVLEHLGEEQQHVAQMLDFKEALLPTLSNNIKCGNSLIGSDFSNEDLFGLSDKEQRKINPFDWQHQFPFLKQTGGFDAVIGNPPYVRIQVMKEFAPREVEIYKTSFKSAQDKNYDIYVAFIEKSLSLLNKKGLSGLIVPNKFMQQEYGENIRRMISERKSIRSIVNFKDQQVFEGATTYTCLLFLGSAESKEFQYAEVSTLAEFAQEKTPQTISVYASSTISDAAWTLSAGAGGAVFEKLQQFPKLETITREIFVGLQTSADKILILEQAHAHVSGIITLHSQALNNEHQFELELAKPIVSGSDVKRYTTPEKHQFVIFPYHVQDDKATLISEKEMIARFPLTWQYLRDNKKALAGRENGKFNDVEWYRFGRNQNITRQEYRKLCVPRLVQRIQAVYDRNGEYYLDNVDVGGVTLVNDSEEQYLCVMGLLNSTLLTWYLRLISTPFRGGFYSCNKQYLSQLPIPPIPDPKPLTALVEKMLDAQAKRKASRTDFERGQWEQTISRLDREIDAVVYGLYGLTAEEIRVVEGSE